MGIVCGSLGSYPLNKLIVQHDYNRMAIEHDCAEYNPKTANFEWIPQIQQIDPRILTTTLPIRKVKK